MKTKMNTLLVMIPLLMFFGCSKAQEQQDVKTLLSDSTKQNEIMNAICADQDMMMNMMGHIINNDDALNMMRGNEDMMTHMMGDGKMMMNMMSQDSSISMMMMGDMMQMMENDSVMCGKMSNMMMNNNHMMNMMMDMMHDKGMKMGDGKDQKMMHMNMHMKGGMH